MKQKTEKQLREHAEEIEAMSELDFMRHVMKRLDELAEINGTINQAVSDSIALRHEVLDDLRYRAASL